MASLYRPIITRWVDEHGNRVLKGTPGAIRKRERSQTFWGKYRVGKRRPDRVALCDDRETAESMLADLAKRARRELSGDVDPFEASRKRPLAEHVAEFEKHLEAKNRSQHHINKTGSNFRRIVDACGWKTLADLSSDDLANYLYDRRQPAVLTQVSLKQAAQIVGDAVSLSPSELRKMRRLVKTSGKPVVDAQRGIPARWEWSLVRPMLAREFGCTLPTRCSLVEPGMSIASSNDYIAAARNFGNWLIKSRPKRWPENPFTSVAKLNADEDVRYERRPATLDELARIVEAARHGRTVCACPVMTERCGTSQRPSSLLIFGDSFFAMRSAGANLCWKVLGREDGDGDESLG